MQQIRIGIVAPARATCVEDVAKVRAAVAARGFKVVEADGLYDVSGRLAGSDAARAAQLHQMFADSDIDAVLAARGGFGCSRILDYLNLDVIRANPKPLIGFSDLTCILFHVSRWCGTPCIHGPMAIGFESDVAGREALLDLLQHGRMPDYTGDYRCVRAGVAQGKVMAGNLAVLTSLVGTKSLEIPVGTILLLEDWHEDVYRIDRMVMQLRHAGILARLGGLVLGDFIELTREVGDYTLDEIFLRACDGYDYPILAGAPVGHGARNMPVLFGSMVAIAAGAVNRFRVV